jgi:hypothetical protein
MRASVITLVTLLFFALIELVLQYFSSQITYLHGKGSISTILWLPFALPFCYPVVLFAIFCHLVKSGPWSYGIQYNIAVGAVIFICSATLYFVFSEPGYKSFTNGFSATVAGNTKISDVRAWAQILLENNASAQSVIHIKSSNVLSVVKDIDPKITPHVSVIPYAATKVVRIEYGGGFGHWGLLITAKGAQLAVASNLYVINIQPDIFVYHDR